MKQFFINLGKAIKNFFLSFKVMNKNQYDKIIEYLLAHKDEAFNKIDSNKDNNIQCSEIIDFIKKAIKE